MRRVKEIYVGQEPIYTPAGVLKRGVGEGRIPEMHWDGLHLVHCIANGQDFAIPVVALRCMTFYPEAPAETVPEPSTDTLKTKVVSPDKVFTF